MLDCAGKTVICVGSGPSLTQEDCKLVEDSGLAVFAVNNSWQQVRSCAVIFAGDQPWWDHHRGAIDVDAELWTCNHSASLKHGVNLFKCVGRHWNSGLRAIELAESKGASRVILLGYDCSVRYGTHWHGPHTRTANPNDGTCNSWKQQFAALQNRTKLGIINCSRSTSLTCFKRANLEETLCSLLFQEETHPKTNLSCVAL